MAHEAKPRVTVSILPDGSFEISLNEAGRDLLVDQLQGLDRTHDHFHLDYFQDPRLAGSTDVLLSATPYHAADEVLESGKVLLRPDDRDPRPHFVGEGI